MTSPTTQTATGSATDTVTRPAPDTAPVRRILVTGGAGFVGRTLVETLRGAGRDVVVADLVAHPDPDVSSRVGDLREAAAREAAVTDDLDAVVHLAAATSVLGSIERPAEVHATNVEMTAGLLELVRLRGVPVMALASTNAVIGDVGTRTITEDLRCAPLTPYGATKAAAESLLSGYAGSYGIRTPVLRLTNVYGRGMTHKDSFVPRLMRAAARGETVQVYGDGEQVRDLVCVDDVAAAFLAALDGWPSGPTIVGNSHSHSVNQIIAAAREATGRPIQTRHVPAKQGEMPAVVVDAARARGLGWSPRVSLAEGLATAWPDFAPDPSPTR